MPSQGTSWPRRAAVLFTTTAVLGLLVPGLATTAARATGVPAGAALSSTAPTADTNGYQWLDYYRALGGEGPLARNATIEAQESLHVQYLANHSLSCESNVHDELTSREAGCGANPYATAAGKAAANNSNVTRVNAPVPNRVAVSNWFVSAFHALVLLEPRLRSTGFAAYYTPQPTGAGTDPYKFTAAVDVYRGRTGGYTGQVLAFPATGAASPLLSYQVGTESPEPFQSTVAGSPCHSWGGLSTVSAPVVVQWPLWSSGPQTGATLVDLSTGQNLPTCGLTAADYPAGSLAQQFLAGTNRVTKAGLYYASAPFVAGHRYQLRIAGTAITTFSTSSLPGSPQLAALAGSRAIRTSWTPSDPGSGTVSYYRLSWFAGAGCTAMIGSITTTGLSYTIGGLTSRRLYYVQAAVKNSLGAVRSTPCYPIRAG
jgi:hypothetical protein